MNARTTLRTCPSDAQDFYADAVIGDPLPYYARLRDLGPVVWLQQQQAYALTQYEPVTQALRDAATFRSGQGVSLSLKVNALLTGSTLNSDPPEHDRTRGVTSAPLLPGALHVVRERIEAAADQLVETLVARGEFDAIADFAQYLPVTIVAELVGLPDAGREKMLKWASATFNLFANDNARATAAFADLRELREFLDEYGTPERLQAGGWAKRIFEVGPGEGISVEICAQLMRDYINPSLDTTISATGHAIALFANNPDQWQLVRAQPELLNNAVEEVVRLTTPIRALSRRVAHDTELCGVALKTDDRVLAIYASANRDPRKFKEPDRFDVTRDVHDHVGFGHGIHMCMGMHLARLEMVSLLRSLTQRVSGFELCGEPVVAMNNTICAYQKLPVRVLADTTRQPQSSRNERVSQADRAAPWIPVVVTRFIEDATDVALIELGPQGSEPLPAFSAGAHIDVKIRDGLVRQYSLSNDPATAERYRLGVLREAESRGGSTAMHANLSVGATLAVSPPRNHFALAEDAGSSLLIAGGIGITPILAMAHTLRGRGAQFALHYCVRNEGRIAFRAELESLDTTFHVSAGPEAQRLDPQSVFENPSDARHLYVCGPRGFMDFIVAEAIRYGWCPDQIHLERFGAEIDTDGAPFTVFAKRTGAQFEVLPGQTIAAQLRAHGIDVPMSCQSGVCGTCLTDVVEGEPCHRDLVQTDAEKASNRQITVCCSRSRTKTLVLDI